MAQNTLLADFLHGWALKCTTGSAFALALSLVWIFLFGLLVVFDQVGQVFEDPGVHVEGKAKHGNYSLVWSWSVPKGVTFCIPSHGGKARSPLSTMPCKWLVVTFNFQDNF